jgi:ribonuclease I
MNQDRIERQKHLEASLSSLLSSMVAPLDPATYDIVRNFTENREYALALEWLVEACSIQKIQFSESQQAEVDRLAGLMEIDLNSQ